MQSWKGAAATAPSCYPWVSHERPREGQGLFWGQWVLEDFVSQSWALPSPTLPWCPFWALCQSQSLAHDCVSLWGNVSKSRVPRGSNYASLAAPGLLTAGSPRQLEVSLVRASAEGWESVGWVGSEPVLSLQPPLCSPHSPHPPHLVCPINSLLGSGWWETQNSFPRETSSSTVSPAVLP